MYSKRNLAQRVREKQEVAYAGRGYGEPRRCSLNGDIIELEQKLDNFREEDPRKAAEVACALAVLHQRAGNTEKAKEVARDTLGLMGRCELDSLEDVVAKNMSLGGVMLPQYFHHRRVIRFFEDNGIRLY